MVNSRNVSVTDVKRVVTSVGWEQIHSLILYVPHPKQDTSSIDLLCYFIATKAATTTKQQQQQQQQND
jgi:hypothetical protein